LTSIGEKFGGEITRV